jgi:outer membrane protein
VKALALLVALVGGRALAQPTLTLDDAIKMARRRHPTVQAQRGQVLSARARGEQALAGLLPYVNGSFGYLPQTANLVITPSIARELVGNTGNATVVDTAGMQVVVSCRSPGVGTCTQLGPEPTSWAMKNFWSMQLGVSWSLWDWGRSFYGWRGARELSSAAEVGVRTVERDVVRDVRLAFFAAVSADEQVAVARDAVATYREHVAQTRAFHDSGLRTGIDVATAESAAASVDITLARALAGQKQARALLSVTLGEDEWHDWKLVADAALFEVQPADERRTGTPDRALTDVALRQRTEPRQLALQERSLGDTARSARGQYLPQLSLNLGPSWAGIELDSLTPNFSIGLVIGYPAGGMSPIWVHGQVREAEGALVQTRALLRATRDNIRQETVGARALLASARDEVVAAHALVVAAARQRALAEGRYQTGVGNVIELYDALLTDVNARFQMVQARLDLASARAQLQHALGEDD